MRNPFTDYKTLLKTFSYEEKINEINKKKKYEIANKKQHGNKIDNRYEQINNLSKWKIILLIDYS